MTKKLDIVVVRRAAQCSHACLPPSALYDVVQSGADGKTKKPAGKGKKKLFSFVFLVVVVVVVVVVIAAV
jgi:hypothetical protein